MVSGECGGCEASNVAPELHLSDTAINTRHPVSRCTNLPRGRVQCRLVS